MTDFKIGDKVTITYSSGFGSAFIGLEGEVIEIREDGNCRIRPFTDRPEQWPGQFAGRNDRRNPFWWPGEYLSLLTSPQIDMDDFMRHWAAELDNMVINDTFVPKYSSWGFLYHVLADLKDRTER